jgi:histidine triad (HIT) family protein
MEDCIFCKVADGSVPSKRVTENDQVVAFEDIALSTLNDVTPSDQELLGAMVMTAIQIAKDRQLSSSGYRLVWNTNRGAGQSVFHIHLHLIGGRAMAWPPG